MLLALGFITISRSAIASESNDSPVETSDPPTVTVEREESDASTEHDQAVAPLAASYPEPTFSPSSVTTDVRQTGPVVLTVTGVDEIPDDQVFLVQLSPPGEPWETVATTTIGAIKAAGSTVSIPRDELQTVNNYYVQLSNWGVSPDYYGTLVTPQVAINVVELPMPSLAQSEFLVDQASPTAVELQMVDYESYPDDQMFTVNIGQAGTGWQMVAQPTVAELRANNGKITIPATNFPSPGSYNVEVTNWGLSSNYYPGLIVLGAGILVGDVSAPALVQSQFFVDETTPVASVTLTVTNLGTAVPDDQLINVQYGPRGEDSGWLPVTQMTMGALRAAGGQIVISGDKIAAPGLYDVEITNWGMSPNYYPSDFILYAEISVGQFPPPQFVEDITYTYEDSTPDVQLHVEDLADLPDDQVLNLQIGLSGSTSGWQDIGTVTLAELRASAGTLTVPRSFLGDVGVYHVQLTNWGMSPDYYPEIFTAGTAINVVESPLLSFTDEEGETITTQEAAADKDATVNVALTGYVPAGAKLVVTVMDGTSVVYSSPATITAEQSATGQYSFEIPGKYLKAEYGTPSPKLTVVASLELPEELAEATVNDAELELTVVATTPASGVVVATTPASGVAELAKTGSTALVLLCSAIALMGIGLSLRKYALR